MPSRVFGSVFRSPIVLVIVLIIILALLLALWAVAANSCKKQDSIVPTTGATVIPPSTTVDDTAQTPGEGAADGGDEQYGSFELAVEPAEGVEPWTEIEVDGEDAFFGGLNEKKTWTVNTNCIVVTAQPGNVKVYRNDVEVEFVIDTDAGSGSVHLAVEKEPTDEQEAGSDG
jgi:hypothetical protein